jgi:hypothetical protein
MLRYLTDRKKRCIFAIEKIMKIEKCFCELGKFLIFISTINL